MDIFCREKTPEGLDAAEIKAALLKSLEGRTLNNVLILPPDFTRFHSNAGLITQIVYHELTAKGCNVDIMPALGTHVPVSKEQWEKMFGDIPYSKMIVHNWRTDVEKIGEVVVVGSRIPPVVLQMTDAPHQPTLHEGVNEHQRMFGLSVLLR